jgi:hypothetical protein
MKTPVQKVVEELSFIEAALPILEDQETIERFKRKKRILENELNELLSHEG